MAELLIGCGNKREKVLFQAGSEAFTDLTTLDIDPNSGADVLHDLNVTPYPFEPDQFNEIHAYEVLEHLGRQGEWVAFFDQFQELWRILKPGGLLCATCPSISSRWAWGDPGHTRVIQPESLVFLSQANYREQVGRTAMTDYRHIWSGDFEPVHLDDNGETFSFVLKAVK